MKRLTAIAALLCLLTGPAGATVYQLPENGAAVFGTDEHIRSAYQDTLLDIARRYSLGYEEIIRANTRVDMWLPGRAPTFYCRAGEFCRPVLGKASL